MSYSHKFLVQSLEMRLESHTQPRTDKQLECDLSNRQLPSLKSLHHLNYHTHIGAPRLPKSVSLNPIQEYASFSGHMRSNDLFSNKAIMQEHKPHRCHLIANKYSRNKVKLHHAPSLTYSLYHQPKTSIEHCLSSSISPFISRPKSESHSHSFKASKSFHPISSLEGSHEHTRYSLHYHPIKHQFDTFDSDMLNRPMSSVSTMHMTRTDSNSKENWESLITTHREGEGSYLSNYKLRVSHKLAERKRRREIKNLVDALKSTLPVDKSAKISKREILSRAVEYISLLRNRDCHRASELLALRKELHLLQSKQATDEKHLRYH